MPRTATITCLLIFWSMPSFRHFGSNTARRVISGTAVPPALCNASPVDMYARTGATSPGLYVCLTTNTWTGPLATSSGSGTVNANSGSVGALAYYPAAAGSTTVGPNTKVLENGTNLVSTEQYIGPLLTGPTYSMVGQSAQGFGDDATIWGPGAPTIWTGANAREVVFFNGMTMKTSGALGWAT